MKRFAVSLISSILAFTAGIFTASSWNSNKHRGASERVIVNAPCPPVVNVSPAVNVSATVPPPEVDIAQGRMKVAPEQVKLTSERLRYNVDVNYPQIVGSDALPIRSVNQNLSTAANRLYEWALDPVCGMRVDAWTAIWTPDPRGRRVSFCSERCRERFVQAPESYAVVPAD